jgi:hypothetical protein
MRISTGPLRRLMRTNLRSSQVLITGRRGSPIVFRSAVVELDATGPVVNDDDDRRASPTAGATDNANTRLVGVLLLARNVGKNVNDSLSLWMGPCAGENEKTAVAG